MAEQVDAAATSGGPRGVQVRVLLPVDTTEGEMLEFIRVNVDGVEKWASWSTSSDIVTPGLHDSREEAVRCGGSFDDACDGEGAECVIVELPSRDSYGEDTGTKSVCTKHMCLVGMNAWVAEEGW